MSGTRRVLALIWKESFQIMRDPSSISIAFVLPLILLLLFGYGVSLDLTDVRFGVALEDPGAAARDLAAAFVGSPNFDARVEADRRPLLKMLASGEVKGIVVIPRGTSSAIDAKRADQPPTIQILTDGTFPNTASLVQNYAMTVASRFFAERSRAGLPISIESRIWYNERVDSRYFVIPALIVVVMTLIGTMLTALVIAREWERGTMEAMLATPIRRVELLLGKLIPYYLLAIVSTFFCTIFSKTFFGIPFRGSFFMLWVVGSIFMVCALAIGLIISSITKDQYAASIGAMMVSFLPAALLSGGIFELSSMPTFQQVVASMLPAKYLTSSLMTLFLVGDVYELIIPDIGALALIGAICVAASIKLTASRLD